MNEGDHFSVCELPNQDGDPVRIDTNGLVVVYFYPEDGTPGCRTEAVQFGKEFETYEELGIDIYGVSTDDPESHSQFADEHDIPFDLLSDAEGAYSDQLGVDVENGRADRTTFVVHDGTIMKRYDNVDPDGHPREILMDLLDDGVVSLD